MPDRIVETLDRHPWSWLVIWTALLAVTHLRWGLGALAWIAPVPVLHYLRSHTGWTHRGLVAAAAVLGWTLATVKIATAPIPIAMAPMYGVPMALFSTAPVLAYDGIRRRLGDSPVVFASLMVLGEWAQHALTPFGSWGATAQTQLDNLPLLQVASVTGAAGVTWLVCLVAGTAESVWAGQRQPRALALAGGAVVVAMAFGSARLAVHESSETVPVAAIGTDSDVTGLPLPTPETASAWNVALAERTRRAAAAGAELAVWTEAATVVWPEDEARFLAEIGALARQAGIEVVAGYIVPVTTDTFAYHNRYAWFTAEGELAHTYDKHNPVPGEPAIAGTAPMPVHTLDGQRRSGAICYDYDFPRFTREHARLDVDLVALPSSDWRGIDPIHTQMAALRAIEGGQSVLRSTRWGLSAGIDPTGRLRSWQSAFEDGDDGVMLARLPRQGIQTLYGWLGDWFVALCAILAVVLPLRGRRRAP